MSELDELKRLGAVPQKNSGRGAHNKGDGIIDNYYIVDIKEYKKSYPLSVDNWAKICTDASASGHEPMLGVVLGDEKKVRVVVLTQDEFLRLRKAEAMLEDMLGVDYHD